MALPFQNIDEDLEKQREESGKQIGAASSVIQGNEVGTPGAQGSGQFTNLQSYLDANKEAKLGEQLAGKVGSDVQAAAAAQKQAEMGFRSKVDKASIAPDEDLFRQVEEDPTKVASDVQKSEQFKKIRDAMYQGPRNLAENSEDYGTAQTATSKAQELAKASESEGGRFGLLQSYYNRPDYNKGQQKLDQLLVQRDPSSQAAFETVRNQAKEQQANFENLKNTLNQYATQKARTTKQAADQAKGLLQSGQSAIKGTVDERLKQRQAEQAAEVERQKQRLASLNPQESYGLQVTDPSRYIEQYSDLSPGTVATKQEQARAAALAQLSDSTGILPNAEIAGTRTQGDLTNFNQEILNRDIAARKAQYEDALRDKSNPAFNAQIGLRDGNPVLANLYSPEFYGEGAKGAAGTIPDALTYLNQQTVAERNVGNEQKAARNQILYNQLLNELNKYNAQYGQPQFMANPIASKNPFITVDETSDVWGGPDIQSPPSTSQQGFNSSGFKINPKKTRSSF